EDGIRDFHVTGVQTCALPICSLKEEKASPTGASTLTATPKGLHMIWAKRSILIFAHSEIERAHEQSTRSAVLSRPETEMLRSSRSEEHTSELQSRENIVCRLL